MKGDIVRHHPRFSEIKILVDAGENYAEVGRAFGVSAESVSRVFGSRKRGNGNAARKKTRAEEQVVALRAELQKLKGEDAPPKVKRLDPARIRARLVDLYLARDRSKGKRDEVVALDHQIHAMTTLAARLETEEEIAWAMRLPLGDDEETTLGEELSRLESRILGSELEIDPREEGRREDQLAAHRRERSLVIERLRHHLAARVAARRRRERSR